MENLAPLIAELKAQAAPGIWSQGLALSRSPDAAFTVETRGTELRVLVRLRSKSLAPVVTLWIEDGDFDCDCEAARSGPCSHAVGAALALQAGRGETPQPASATDSPTVYRFARVGQALAFGREAPSAPATRAEQELEALLKSLPHVQGKPLEPDFLHLLLKKLEDLPPSQVTLDGQPIRTVGRPYLPEVELRERSGRITLRRTPLSDGPVEVFTNGAMLLRGGQAGEPATLRARKRVALSDAEQAWLSDENPGWDPGHWAQALELLTRVLPAFETKARVQVPLEVAARLPRLEALAPRVVLALEEHAGDRERRLSVFPRLVYGDPPVAEVPREGQNLQPTGPFKGVLPVRDVAAENQALQKLRQELHLRLGEARVLSGAEAVSLRERLKHAPHWEVVERDQASSFLPAETLAPRLEWAAGAERGGLSFLTPDGGRADAQKVLDAHRAGEPYVPLLGGGWARLPGEWISEHLPELRKLLERLALNPKLERPAWAAWAERAQLALPEGLMPFSQAALAPPTAEAAARELTTALKAQLRPYQLQGVAWLLKRRELGWGALLADDMGLGKTVQALATLATGDEPTLVIAPTSVLGSWREQIQRFRPELRVCVYHGSQRRLEPGAHVVLTTYGVVRQDHGVLAPKTWDTVVLDEAHTIKNAESQTARAVLGLQGRWKLALTGTPLENRLSELKSLFSFLQPGLLDEETPLTPPALRALRDRIRPHLLRRLKSQVAQDLPPKTEVVLRVSLSEEERTTYRALIASSRAKALQALEDNQLLTALELLLRLRQVCCDPRLLPGAEPGAADSSKIELLVQTLRQSIEGGHRVLVFSQWTRFLDLIQARLKTEGWAFERLDGQTLDRDAVIRRFQNDSGPPVMLLSLKAGGVGITLTAADHVILTDPWWNPAIEDQAADRAHRIGQARSVIVFKLLAEDTLEESILALQAQKRGLAQALLDAGEDGLEPTPEGLTASEIRSLLGSLG